MEGDRWTGEVPRHDDGLGCSIHDQHPPSLVPAYLKWNRHVRKLKRDWDKHLEELREKAESDPHLDRGRAGKQALSRSSSSVNLGKTPGGQAGSGVHRGVAQDIIERMPPMHQRHHEDDGTHPLPTRWSEDDKLAGMEILGDGSEVRFTGVTKTSDDAASIWTDQPIPRECGLYYFEITVISRNKEGQIGVGLSGRRTTLNRLPGWEAESWAYHGDDGFLFTCSPGGKAFGPQFATQDVVGCGINFRTGSIFFTKNGVFLGESRAIYRYKFPSQWRMLIHPTGNAVSGIRSDGLYPSVGVKRPNEHLRANFGRSPFVFDIEGMMNEEWKLANADLNKADVASLHPPDDESILIHKLIGQYLAHEGYVETSKAFAADIRDRAAPSDASDALASLADVNSEDNVHAIHRQKIRRAILDGDIDKALKYTQSYYPQVLQDERNKDIYFRLRCRKFVELMKKYAELRQAEDNETISTDSAEDEDEQADTQMELDSQLQQPPHTSNDDDVDMATSTSSLPPKPMKADDYLTAAITYGQELQAEFGSDPRPLVKKELADIFAIMAYTNPVNESVLIGVLDVNRRATIAQGINGAILGKSRSHLPW